MSSRSILEREGSSSHLAWLLKIIALACSTALILGCSDDDNGTRDTGVADMGAADAGMDAGDIDSAAVDGPAADIAVTHKAIAVTLAHMNDTHAQFEPITTNLKLAGSDTRVSLGGLPRLVAKIKDLRASEQNLLALHAGDLFQGTLYFIKYLGLADLELLKLMELDAMVVGNHEFDKGPKILATFVSAAKANFPTLGGNVDASTDPDLAGKLLPYTIKQIDGEQVAIIGLVTPDVPTTSNPGDTVIFNDHISSAKKLVQEIEAMGINKIIVLSHLGLDEDVKLAETVEGIDVIIGGHHHKVLMGDETKLGELQANPQYGGLPLTPTGPYPSKVQGPGGKDVCIAHAWPKTEALGVLRIEVDEDGFIATCTGSPVMLVGDTFMRFNPAAGKVEEVTGQDKTDIVNAIASSPLIEVMAGDPDALSRLGDENNGYMKGVVALKNQKVATIAEDLVHVYTPGTHYMTGVEYPKGSHLAPHVAEAMLEKLIQNSIDAQITLINAGGIKKDLMAGDCSVGDVYEMLPHGNTLVVLELTGQQIKDQIEQAVTNAHEDLSTGTGKRFPYPGGARYTADMTQPENSRITSLEVKDASGAWQSIDLQATYKLGTVNFLADGGDLYDVLKNATGARLDTGFVDAEAFMEYAESKGTLSQPADTGVTYIPPSSP